MKDNFIKPLLDNSGHMNIKELAPLIQKIANNNGGNLNDETKIKKKI